MCVCVCVCGLLNIYWSTLILCIHPFNTDNLPNLQGKLNPSKF